MRIISGEKIRLARKQRHITQSELAASVGCSMMTVRRWEKDMRLITIENLIKVADALNVRIEELYEAPVQSDPGLLQMIEMYKRWTPMQRSYVLDRMHLFDKLIKGT